MKTMKKKTLLVSILALLLLFIIIVSGYVAHTYHSAPLKPHTPIPAPATIVGGLVAIGTHTITVKSAAGTQMIFTTSVDTRVLSRVKEGDVGKTYTDLRIGDVLAVTASGGSTPQTIEMLPLDESPSFGALPPVTLFGSLVSVSTSSVTVKPLTNDLSMQSMLSNVTVQIQKNTQVLSQVLGGEPGISLAAAQPGTTVTIMGTSTDKGITARTIVIMRP